MSRASTGRPGAGGRPEPGTPEPVRQPPAAGAGAPQGLELWHLRYLVALADAPPNRICVKPFAVSWRAQARCSSPA